MKTEKLKSIKGITLIALIITIIVMLILVGVTINVALNGGLFNTASDATRDTEMNTIYDQIVGAMKLTDNGNVNVKGTYDEVVKIFGNDKVRPTNPTTGGEITTEVTFTVTGKRGTYTYKITTTEIIKNPKQKNYLEFESGKTYGAFKVNSSFKINNEILREFGFEEIDKDGEISLTREINIEGNNGADYVWLELYVEYEGESIENGINYIGLNTGCRVGGQDGDDSAEGSYEKEYRYFPEKISIDGELYNQGWYESLNEGLISVNAEDIVELNGSWAIPESLDNEAITIINNTFGELFILEN